MDFNEGEIIYIDKPLHWTSFDVLKRIRLRILRRIKQKKLKVGHAGTLDPLATGVMIICTGRATKRIEEFQYQTKEYIATLRLGATTPSFDLETEIDGVYPHEHITRESVERTLPRFVGSIMQIPPSYSACKVDLPEIKIRVVCSKGTYIRALARDIGEALGSGAHLVGLIRTRVGDVTLADCLSVEQVADMIDHIDVEPVLEEEKKE